jgi:voltage-gated potassium channel
VFETPLPSRPLLRRVLRPVAAFAAVVVVGVAGFVVLAGVGIVDAAFWLVDPTSVELHFAEHDGPERAAKALSIAVRVGLVVTSIWIGETAVKAAFGGQIQQEFKRMRNEKRVDELSDHVIICGYGIFGRTVATHLREDGHDVLALEIDSAEFEGIDTDDILAMEADARQESALREAGIEDAQTVVAAIDNSNANIQIAITASQLAPDVRVIVRVGDEMYETLAHRAGADEVVIPEVISGETVSDRL